MTKIVAAIDNSLVCRAVLDTAESLGALLGASVDAVHVGDGTDATVRAAAEAARVPLRVVRGDLVDALGAAGEAPDVVAVVIGARGVPGDPRPLGSTALAVATSLSKPVVIVPPEATPGASLRRVLVPLEGNVSTSLAPRGIIGLAGTTELEVVALHVHDAASFPSFTDQPQHEQQAWTREFLARYCPWGIGDVRLETRIGNRAALVPAVAAECGCGLIVLGWSQDLAPGRAEVVRAALERGRVPVMLVPVVAAADPGPRLDGAEAPAASDDRAAVHM